MSERRPIDSDPVSFCELLKELTGKVRSVVGNDRVGYAKPIHDVEEEFDYLLQIDGRDRSGLYPLGELVHRDEQVGEPARCLS